MRRGWRLVAASAVLALAAAGCGGSSRTASPRFVPLPRILDSDSAATRADKLARYIERRWPRIEIQDVHANRDGSVIGFNDLAAYDSTITDTGAYTRHVARLTGDLDQASVELLPLTTRYFPNLRYVTVWQDRQLMAFWSPEDIVAMDRAENYRNYNSYLRLIMSASLPPSGEPLPAPTS